MPIPKKPLAVSKAKKNLPVSLDWGEGILKDRLRYINADEEALIKRFRTSKSARDYAGIPAYADDSASSKGVSRGTTTGTTTTKSSTGSGSPAGGSMGQGGQSRGPSGAGQGPNSPASSSSGSKSPSSSPSSPSASGGGYKGQSAASVGPSRAPNAAAQAASNAYRSPQTNTSVSPGTGKAPLGAARAPNAAASYASQKLNATSNALRSAQQPQSIQGMINSGPPSGFMSPEQQKIDRQNTQYSPNALNNLYKNIGSFDISDIDKRTAAQQQLLGQTIGASKYGGTVTANVNNSIDGKGLTDPFSDTVVTHWTGGPAPLARMSGNGYAVTIDKNGDINYTRAFNQDGLMRSTNQLYGMNKGHIGVSSQGIVPNQAQLQAASVLGRDWFNKDARVTTHGYEAGTRVLAGERDIPNKSKRPENEGLDLAGAFTGRPAQGNSWTPSNISNRPTNVASLNNGNVPSAGNAGFASARPVSAPPLQGPAAPSRSPTMSLSNPFGSYNPVAAGRMASLQTRLGVDDALSAGSVQTASNDAPAPVYSDNPVQGSTNPMQDEGENPQVKRDRQMKYASRGATIGGVIAGPIGTIVGGTLGWQMGKTTPQQRQAIASNPQALQANVQSINDMVDERGGKNNPNLKVTEIGLKDVLENPQKVTANPQAYTSLEQSLAALSQGIDPETGRAI